MAVNSVGPSVSPAQAAPVQPPRQNDAAKQAEASREKEQATQARQADEVQKRQAEQAQQQQRAQQEQPPKPVTNSQGQVTGQLLNTVA